MKRIVTALCALLLFASIASPVDPLFQRGETLDYDLTWLALTGGRARMTIAPQLGDPNNYRITSIAQSSSTFSRIYKVRDEIESVVQRNTFTSLRYHKNLREGSNRKDDTTVFSAGVATRKGKQYAVPTPVFDPLSLLYYMRTQPLLPGHELHYTVFADKKTYDVIARVARRETISTPAGKFAAVVVEPEMHAGGIFKDEDSKLTIWYSDDDRHLIVRLRSDVKIGSITATLRGVTPGVTSINP